MRNLAKEFGRRIESIRVGPIAYEEAQAPNLYNGLEYWEG